MIADAKALAGNVVVTTIAPVEHGRPLGDLYFDTDLIDEYNKIILQVASENEVRVLRFDALSDRNGFAKKGLTSDGVHLTRDGYQIWQRAFSGDTSSTLACNG